MYDLDLLLFTKLFCSCFVIAFGIALIFAIILRITSIFIEFVKGGKTRL